MGLKLLSRHNSAGGGDAIADLRGQVIGVLEDVRALAVELRSPALPQLGLVPALESLARDMRERGDGEIAVRADEVPEPIPDAVETAAYRIVQEALQIARGASPTPSLRVRVGRCPQRTDARLELVLELPQATVAPSLAGISARTNLVSGSLEAQTSAERGTRLRVMLPLAGSGRTATAE
jgi:signal transduction histidine kinase